MNPVFDRNGVPLSQIGNRHSSMPAYMEYSPAPSFVSSHFEDYSTRGLSYEPLTPPQHATGMPNESAYIANEDTGLYTAIPEVGLQQPFNPLMAVAPSFPGAQYPSMARNFQPQQYPCLKAHLPTSSAVAARLSPLVPPLMLLPLTQPPHTHLIALAT